MRTLDDSKPS